MKLNLSGSSLRPPKKARTQAAKRVRVGLIVSMVLLGLFVGTLLLSRNASRASNSVQRSQKKYVATKAIIVDQASGQLRKPTAEETQALVDQVSKLTNRSSEGLTVNTQPNGMKSMNLEGRFSGVVLGRANADGTTEVRCVFTMEEAAAFLGLEEVTSPEQ